MITDCDITASKLRRLKDFGRSSGGTDIHETIGYNFKFTELQACIGIEQMKKLEDRVARKKEIYNRYAKLLENEKNISLFFNDNDTTAPWFIDATVVDRENLQLYLKQKNIGTRVMYPPINKQKAYDIPGNHKVSNLVGDNGLWLPSSVQLTDEQISHICASIQDFYSR